MCNVHNIRIPKRKAEIRRFSPQYIIKCYFTLCKKQNKSYKKSFIYKYFNYIANRYEKKKKSILHSTSDPTQNVVRSPVPLTDYMNL